MNLTRYSHIAVGLLLTVGWMSPEVLAIKFTPPQTLTLAQVDLSMTPLAEMEQDHQESIGDASSASGTKQKKSSRSKRAKSSRRSKKKSKRSKKSQNHTLKIKIPI